RGAELAERSLLLHRLLSRHAGRRAAGHRPGGDRRHAVAVHLRAQSGAGVDHACRHLLRRPIRRLDHGDPGQHPRRVVLRGGHARRPPDGPPAPPRGIAAMRSFVAGCLATLVTPFFAPPLAELALKFSPAEYFSLMVFGLIAAVVLARGSLIKAIAMVCFGILLGLVGTDVNSG